jgi:diguanylate cyclase (GGDEF)-like protein
MILAAIFLISRLTKTESELVKKVDELMILTSVSEAASSGLDLLPMVETFARKLCDALKAEGIGIVFKQPYSTTLFAVQVEAQKSRTKQLPTEERDYQYDSLPLSEPSSKLGSSLYEFLQPLETAPFMIPPSVFGVPLIYRGEPIGGMVVYSSNQKSDFSAQNDLLNTCAHSLVVGMENCFLHLQAIEDPLTGLYNRSYFLYRLQEELSYSNRHESEFALMMLDLDDFKVVNDHLGHQAGDEVLKRIGDLFRVTLRREDVPARYGGDEFIILLLDCDENNAYEKAKKLRQIISIRALPKEKGQGLQIGCSISLISSTSLQGDYDIPSILKKLDTALYQAKAEGKNVIVKID